MACKNAGMSLDRIGAEVDLRRQEFLNECAEHVGVGQARNLVAKLEVLQLVKSFTKSFTNFCIEQARLAKNSLQSGLLFGVGFLMDWQTPVAVAIAALAAVYVLWRLARPFFRDQSHRDEPLQIDHSDD